MEKSSLFVCIHDNPKGILGEKGLQWAPKVKKAMAVVKYL